VTITLLKRLSRYTLLLAVTAAISYTAAGQFDSQSSGTRARLRGVSAVDAKVAWASGSNGAYLKTRDGGATWTPGTVPGAEALDFRDVDAFDAATAYLLSIGEGDKSRIYKTTDGGSNWTLQFASRNPKAFFDSIAFWDVNNGIAVSDPVDGRFLLIKTTDGGVTWKEVSPIRMPHALPGEAAFAASGTCITVQGRNNVWFGTGGAAARVFRSSDQGNTWDVAATPILSGQPSTGIFSIAFRNDAQTGIVVGGDYTKEGEARDNVAATTDGGRTWKLAEGSLPGGFRSGVAYVPGASGAVVAVGPLGSDYSLNNGRSWTNLGTIGYNAISLAGEAGWAVGESGRVGRFSKRSPLASSLIGRPFVARQQAPVLAVH
jgi:photosystem II stability/assembly factor-like uncharacterized protein